jgi:YidC/Oxa1 family membrane protein insertase
MIKFFINFLNKVKNFFSSLNILIDLVNLKPKIVFFSENKSYQKYSKPIIDVFCSKSSETIYYFSIDKDDKIINKKVHNYYVNSILLNFVFNNIKAENIFLTLTDLGNNLIKKTKNINQYIYYFHSPVSTTKNYTPKAFDNYDLIMCNGQFQIDEIRKREFLKKLPKKKLISSGYFYFDFLIKNINYETNPNSVLIAPSWNKNMKNYINENFIELMNVLIKKKYKVIFRPHPEHFKRSKNILKNIKNKFPKDSFEFDEDINNIKSLEKAKCLITDSSGIAIEYLIALKRPVLYLNEHDKIHNSEFEDYSSLKTIDQKIKEDFGYLFELKDFNQIDFIINNSEKMLRENLPKLDGFIADNYFNFGNTANFLNLNSKQII